MRRHVSTCHHIHSISAPCGIPSSGIYLYAGGRGLVLGSLQVQTLGSPSASEHEHGQRMSELRDYRYADFKLKI